MQLKDPFSLYDFLGYLFPGMIFILFVFTIYKMEAPLSFTAIIDNGAPIMKSWKEAIPFVIISYIAGHLISYFSSLTVESFLIWTYGYPSDFLINKDYHRCYFSKNEKVGSVLSVVWKSIVALVLFPITVASLVFGRVLRFKYYVLKPLDDQLISDIKAKTKALMAKLTLPYSEKRYDYHRIIMHYNYEHYEKHIPKYNNYIALYGFLRSMALLFNIFFIYCFFVETKTFDMSVPFDLKAIKFLVFLFLLSYIFYLGFVKFYRRFTLENFMSITQDPDLKTGDTQVKHETTNNNNDSVESANTTSSPS